MQQPTSPVEVEQLISQFRSDLNEEGKLTGNGFKNGLILDLLRQLSGEKNYRKTAIKVLELGGKNEMGWSNNVCALRLRIFRLDEDTCLIQIQEMLSLES